MASIWLGIRYAHKSRLARCLPNLSHKLVTSSPAFNAQALALRGDHIFPSPSIFCSKLSLLISFAPNHMKLQGIKTPPILPDAECGVIETVGWSAGRNIVFQSPFELWSVCCQTSCRSLCCSNRLPKYQNRPRAISRSSVQKSALAANEG